MNDPLHPSGLERVAGNLATEAALTVVAALAGGPLAPLLPVLAKSLAASRQQQRVQQALIEMRQVLESHEAEIRDLTDEQYKLVNESILAILQTTQAEKLIFLRSVATNALKVHDLGGQAAIVLSRIVRDISAEEVTFLLRAFEYEGVLLNENVEQSEVLGNVLRIAPSSPEALSVIGLQSLGLLAPPETGWDSGAMRFTAIVAKLIALVREPDAS
jgi:hypothetical protein